MNKHFISSEVAALLAIRPTEAELDEAIALCDTVLAAVVRGPAGWEIDPALARIAARHSPARILREARIGREAALVAKAALNAA